MKLSPLERDVIGALFFNADAKVSEVARELGMREHRVRSAIQRLKQEKIVSPHFYINPSRLGLTDFSIVASLPSHGATEKKRLMDALQSSEYVSFLSKTGGKWEFTIGVLARGPHDLARFFEGISQAIGSIPFQKIVSVQTAVHFFPPKYLRGEAPLTRTLSYRAEERPADIDGLDLRILAALHDIQDINYPLIARKVGIAQTTLAYRIKGLQSKGVLLGWSLYPNAAKLGIIPYRFIVRLNSTNSSVRKRLYDFCKHQLNIAFLGEEIGAWDYEMSGRFEAAHEVAAFVEEFRNSFRDILAEIEPVPYFQNFKMLSYPFISGKRGQEALLLSLPAARAAND